MRLFSIALPAELSTATAVRFRQNIAAAGADFVAIAGERLAPVFAEAVLRLAAHTPDTPATRAWMHTVTRLSAVGVPSPAVPDAALLSHIEADSAEVGRLFELLCWELAGAVCDGSSEGDIDLPDPPRVLPIGVAGAFLTGDRRRSSGTWTISRTSGYSLRGPGFAATAAAEDSMWKASIPVHSAGIRSCIPLHTPALTDWSFQEFPMVRCSAYAKDWALSLEHSARIISEYSPAAAGCVEEFVRCAVPLVGGAGVIGSASRAEALGLVFLPATTDTSDLTECLLHEAMHQYLFRIEYCGDLFMAATDMRDVYYSPWRPDPRSLRMTLHGAFVFTAVADLYLWEHASAALGISRQECQRRAHYRALQSACALETVRRHAQPTRFGQIVLDVLGHDVALALERADPATEDRVDIERLLIRHREQHADYVR